VSSCLFEIVRAGMTVTFEMPSRPDLIDEVVWQCDLALREISSLDVVGVMLVLRELLSNAIVHGNKSAVERTVRACVECVHGCEFRISVEDEGHGFDYHTMNVDVPEDPRQVRKRGYILIGNIVQALMFNEKGNHVTAWVAADR